MVEAATYCYLCGDGPRDGDPFVADHVIPRVLGGPDTLDNLAPAHRSCNGRKGQTLSCLVDAFAQERPGTRSA